MFKGSSSKTEAVNSPDKLNRLVEGTSVKGDIKTDSNFRLDGELIGTLNTLGKLVVGPTGKIEGEIVCGNADIEGEVTGNIKVDGILLLKSTAKFRGNIIAQKLAIENGADFNGNCHMGAGQPKFEQIVTPVAENELVY
jgi:cytoskeletal protein CcmA (bactofilin family)